MIYTVTLNPTLDKTLSMPQLRPGEFHRARMLRADLSGKHVNITRAFKALSIRYPRRQSPRDSWKGACSGGSLAI